MRFRPCVPPVKNARFSWGSSIVFSGRFPKFPIETPKRCGKSFPIVEPIGLSGSFGSLRVFEKEIFPVTPPFLRQEKTLRKPSQKLDWIIWSIFLNNSWTRMFRVFWGPFPYLSILFTTIAIIYPDFLGGGKSFCNSRSIPGGWSHQSMSYQLPVWSYRRPRFEILAYAIRIETIVGWWLNQPLWKICSSNWSFPPNNGWKYKIFETITQRNLVESPLKKKLGSTSINFHSALADYKLELKFLYRSIPAILLMGHEIWRSPVGR